MRNMANVSQGRKAYGNNRDENGAMGNGREPVRTPEQWGNLGRSKGGSDSDSYETEKAGMVWTRQKERWNWKTSEQLQKWRWRGSALEDDQSCDGKILSEGTWKPGKSRRNGPPTEKNGKVSARPATPNRETAAKGEKGEKVTPHDWIHASTFHVSESFPLYYNRVYWTNSILEHAYHTIFGQTKGQSTRVIFIKELHQNKALENGDESRIFRNLVWRFRK